MLASIYVLPDSLVWCRVHDVYCQCKAPLRVDTTPVGCPFTVYSHCTLGWAGSAVLCSAIFP